MRTAIAVSMFSALVLLGGCRVLEATPAQVFRFTVEDNQYRFRACTLTLGWTRDELWHHCGVPDAQIERVGGRGPCYAYHSAAHSLGTTDGVAPVMLACVDTEKVYKSRDANNPKAREQITTEVVSHVYGVTKLP